MLTAVTIKGFRSCLDTSLDNIGQIVALVGRNGAGKTNVLRAIQWAAHMAMRRRDSDALARTSPNDNSRVALEFELGGRSYRYEVREYFTIVNNGPQWKTSEELQAKDQGEWRNFIYRNGKVVLIQYGEDSVQSFAADPEAPMLPAAISFSPECAFIGDFLNGIRYYPLNEQNLDGTTQEYKVLESRLFIEWDNSSPLKKYSGSDAEMRILYMHLFDQDKFDEFTELVGPKGLGLVKSISVHGVSESDIEYKGKKLPMFHWVAFKNLAAGANTTVPFKHLSYGTRRLLDLISILIFDKSTVCLIEHPEEGIHSGLFRRAVGVLQQYADPAQLIVTTHSGEFFNRLPLEDVRFVSVGKKGTTVSRLKGEKLAAAEAYIGDEAGNGGTLSDFLEVCGEEELP